MLPLLPESTWRPTYDALWQTAAGLHSAYRIHAVPEPVPTSEPRTPADLAEHAIATGDPHAIKMTEACLRQYDRRADPIFLHAAGRASEVLAPDHPF
ncbi:hypothetical protein EV193_10237 [Herbihabitans rhizosphaerae]|uniref:Uncharacterized protein n=1 Tax=Herbihabitans rhizosphaerae TaxID=1872711 RepID=A0A4Q7L3M5_9PSEU|nr:hypothetical protein EV193_10237 [Herbihabitans rhizosphaerae]